MRSAVTYQITFCRTLAERQIHGPSDSMAMKWFCGNAINVPLQACLVMSRCDVDYDSVAGSDFCRLFGEHDRTIVRSR